MKIDKTNKQSFGMKFTLIGPNAAKYARYIKEGFAKEGTSAGSYFCETPHKINVASGNDYFELENRLEPLRHPVHPACFKLTTARHIAADFFKDAIEIITN